MSDANRNIYTRITGELEERLKIAAAKKRLKQPAAIAEAIEQWIEATEQGIAAPKASKGGNTGQALSSHYRQSTREVVPSHLVLHDPNPDDMVTIELSRNESEWVLGLLEVIRCDAPGVAQWIQGNIKVFRDWVRGQANDRTTDTVPPSGTIPGIQGGTGGDQPGTSEADKAAQSALDSISRVKESFDPAPDRGAQPPGKTDRRGGKTGTGGSGDR